MLTILVKLLKALNSEQSPSQLAIAVSLAVVLGFTPILSLHNLLIIFFALWFRVNLSLLLVSYPLFVFIGFLLSSIFDSIGLQILQMPALQSVWESFFNTLFGRWSNFYYAGVIGSFTIGVIVAIILFPLVRFSVLAYREKWLQRFNQLKVMRMLKASKFWQLYAES